MCYDPVVKTNLQRQQQLVSTGAMPATTAALSQGYCTYAGCWTLVNDTHATFLGSVNYYYGSTLLGHVQLGFNVALNVYTITVSPFYSTSSRATGSTVLIGDRLYVSQGAPGGNTESNFLYRKQTSCGLRGYGISCQWSPSTGYATRETTVQAVSMLAETKWSDTSSAYPGHWYSYAKSIDAFRDPNNGTGYHFNGGIQLPTTPASAGWTAT